MTKILITLTLLTSIACAPPTYQPSALDRQWAQEKAVREAREREEAARKAQERAEAARQWVKFYDTYPILKGREKCVGRAMNTLAEKTWGNLALRAISFCVAPPPPLEGNTAWVKVATASDGQSTFLDTARIEFRKDNQVTYWALCEEFDDEHDFLLDRNVVDCDKKINALISGTWIVAGKYYDPTDYPVDWKNVLPNSVGEAIVNTVCGLRAARAVKPARKVQKRADFSKPEI
jgi:hypothetical protein